MSSTTILLYTKLHVSAFLNGHHQAFQQIESTDSVCTLGSQCVYIDKIHKIQQVDYIRRRKNHFKYFNYIQLCNTYITPSQGTDLPDFYVFYRSKHIGIPICTQHLLTQSVRRPEDDRLKGRNMQLRIIKQLC